MKKRILITAAVLSAMIFLCILPFKCKGQGYTFKINNPGYGSDSVYRKRATVWPGYITEAAGQPIPFLPGSVTTLAGLRTFYSYDTVFAFYIVYIPHPMYNNQEFFQSRIVQFLRKVEYPDGMKYFDENGTYYDVLYYQDYENIFHWVKFPCPLTLTYY